MDTRRTPDRLGTELPYRLLTDRREIEHRMRQAHQMRAEVTMDALVWVSRGVARLGRALVAAPLARQRRRRATYRELMAYSDRELDEIGVRRADVPAIAREQAAARAGG